MAKPNFRETTVISSIRLTPNMQRVRLGSDALNDFPDNSEGDYIKLLFHPSTGEALNHAKFESLEGRPTLRTYTVKYFDTVNLHLDVDFVIHGDELHAGPASSWAQHCQKGDQILLGGPGAGTFINDNADYLIFAGDMTALPAISANLSKLSASAKGIAVIEIASDADKQDLSHPLGIEILWVIKPHNLFDAITHMPWPKGTVSAWVATEFSVMKALRMYLKKERGLERENLYISSYWKEGSQEDEHKLVKREDAQNQTS